MIEFNPEELERIHTLIMGDLEDIDYPPEDADEDALADIQTQINIARKIEDHLGLTAPFQAKDYIPKLQEGGWEVE
jgi:hypothetical protein